MIQEHVTFFERNGVVGIIKLHHNFTGNFKPDEYPNIRQLEHESPEKALEVYNKALIDSKNRWWKVVYSGKPVYG